MSDTSILSQMIAALPDLREFHAPTNSVYALLRDVVRREVVDTFSTEAAEPKAFGPFGDLVFPYVKMGAIDSLDLFGLDELIIFSFYWRNRARYRRVLDLGANIGLHSIMLARAGFSVTCYEPEPHHLSLLNRNLTHNAITTVTPKQAAVAIEAGSLEFIRVLGNTTGSHLAGSKTNVYGDVERFNVEAVTFNSIIGGVDFIKMDVEGQEKKILTATRREHWQNLDMMCEIGSAENAASVFDHFQNIGINTFAQKIGWAKVGRVEDMPTSHRDGSLFISAKAEMPWNE
jgi:FkbM family methyltransferase